MLTPRAVRLSGIDGRTIEVRCDAGSLGSAEVPGAAAAISGALPRVVDASVAGAMSSPTRLRVHPRNCASWRGS